MSSQGRKDFRPETGKDYESTVLDFLDKEISASKKQLPDQKAPQDEMDAVVSDLLKLAKAVTEEQDLPQEAKAEELDSLVADILEGRTAPSQPDTRNAPAPAQKDSAFTARGNTRPFPVERGPKPEAVVQPRVQAHPAAPARESTSTQIASGQVPLKAQPAPHARAEASQTTPVDKGAPVYMAPAAGHSRRGKLLVASAGLVCVLALVGAGVYYFTGSRSGAANQSGKTAPPPAATAATAAPASSTAVPVQVVPDPGAATKEAPARASTPSAERSAPAASESRPKNVDAAPAPTRKEEKTAAAKTPEPPPQPVPAAETAKPAASVDRPTTPSVVVTESSAPPRPAVNEPPPVTVITQSPPAPLLGRPVPTTLPKLDAAAPPPTSQAAVAKKVNPAVLITQVRPVYPEVARKMRLTGTVRLEIQIDEQGKVVKAVPLSGPPFLQSTAVEAVMKWRYKPAMVGDTPIRSQGQVAIVFNNP